MTEILFACGRKVADNGEWQTVMTEYLTIVARILILDPMAFNQLLQELNIPQPLDVILDVWLTKMPLIVQSDKTKLMSKYKCQDTFRD